MMLVLEVAAELVAPALATRRQALPASAREGGEKLARKGTPLLQTVLRRAQKMVLARRTEQRAIAVATAEFAVAEEERTEAEVGNRGEDRSQKAEEVLEETVAAATEALRKVQIEDPW